jgi:hypothetical protein
MPNELPHPLKTALDEPIGNYVLQCYLVQLECPCGHSRELRPAFIRKVLGETALSGQMQRRFRCAQCSRRSPQVHV